MSSQPTPIAPRRRVDLSEEAWQSLAHLPETERADYVSDLILSEARRRVRRKATYRIEVLRADGTLHHSERGMIARQVVARLKRERSEAGGRPRTRTLRCIRETDGREMVIVDSTLIEQS